MANSLLICADVPTYAYLVARTNSTYIGINPELGGKVILVLVLLELIQPSTCR